MSTDYTTLAAALAAFTANAGWFEDQSVTKAATFVTATTALIAKLPNSSLKGSNSVGFSKSELKAMLDEARAYVQANRTAGGVRRADLRYSRQ